MSIGIGDLYDAITQLHGETRSLTDNLRGMLDNIYIRGGTKRTMGRGF